MPHSFGQRVGLLFGSADAALAVTATLSHPLSDLGGGYPHGEVVALISFVSVVTLIGCHLLPAGAFAIRAPIYVRYAVECCVLILFDRRGWQSGTPPSRSFKELWSVPCSVGLRVGCVFGRHTMRTFVHIFTAVLTVLLVIGPVQGWRCVPCLHRPRVCALVASVCAAFRPTVGASVLFVASLLRRLALALSALLGCVGGGARLCLGEVPLRLSAGIAATERLVGTCQLVHGAWCLLRIMVVCERRVRASAALAPSGAKWLMVLPGSSGLWLGMALRHGAAERYMVTMRHFITVEAIGFAPGSMSEVTRVCFSARALHFNLRCYVVCAPCGVANDALMARQRPVCGPCSRRVLIVTAPVALTSIVQFYSWWVLPCSVAVLLCVSWGWVLQVGGDQRLIPTFRFLGSRALSLCFDAISGALSFEPGHGRGNWEAQLDQGRSAGGWQWVLASQWMSVVSDHPCPVTVIPLCDAMRADYVVALEPVVRLLAMVRSMMTVVGTMFNRDRSVSEARVPMGTERVQGAAQVWHGAGSVANRRAVYWVVAQAHLVIAVCQVP